MVTAFVPSGFQGTWEGKQVNEIIEKYLQDNWTENDIPKGSEIRFGYLLTQNVNDIKVTLSLKCIDNGQAIYDKGTNYASCIFSNKVIVHLEGRKIMDNFAKDYPIGLEQMKLKIITIIASDPLALRNTEGIHNMSVESINPIYPIKDKANWFAVDVNVTVTRFMSKVDIP